MNKAEDEHHDEASTHGASGCLIALVVIAMFACYGLGIFTGAYGQRYLDAKKAESAPQPEVDPEEADPSEQEAVQKPLEAPFAEPLTQEHGPASIKLDIATVRFTKVGVETEVSLPGLLLFRLKVRNITDQPLEFSSWMHTGKDSWLAGLSDDKNYTWEAIHDADPKVGLYLVSLPQYHSTQTIAAGEEAITWVAFIAPKHPLSALKLTLPAANLGGEGFIHFEIPAGAVVKGPEIE